jgi:hypothetical protein
MQGPHSIYSNERRFMDVNWSQRQTICRPYTMNVENVEPHSFSSIILDHCLFKIIQARLRLKEIKNYCFSYLIFLLKSLIFFILKVFLKNFILYFFIVLYCFHGVMMLMSKINFKKLKKYIIFLKKNFKNSCFTKVISRLYFFSYTGSKERSGKWVLTFL